MLKVVIVEDELKILTLLVKMIDWNSYGFEIIATENNGISGEQTIKTLQPDIVISDIRMPGQDGIAMIKNVKPFTPNTEFIILSGFRHFEYAHSAISLGIKSYLLKPIDEQELIEILLSLKDKLSKNTKNSDFPQNELLYIDHIRKTFISSFVINDSSHFTNSVDNINKIYHTKFENANYLAISLQFYKHDINQTVDKLLLLEQSQLFISKLYKDFTFECISSPSLYDLAIILNYDISNKKQLDNCHEILVDHLISISSNFGKFFVSLGIGTEVNNIFDIRKSYNESLNSMKSIIQDNKINILHPTNPSDYPTINVEYFFNNTQKMLLFSHIQNNDSENIKIWFDELASNAVRTQHFYPPYFYDLCKVITDNILDFIISSTKIEFNKIELFSQLELVLLSATSITSLFNILYNFINSILQGITISKSTNNSKLINLACQYIDNNFKEQLHLSDVASYVNISPTYLCSLFKTENDMTFSEYLTQKRMEYAKHLLRETNLNILTISMECGYLDTKYFSKLFNKHVGIRPSEYRNLYC